MIMGNSITIYLKKAKGDSIPIEYNYYLAINFYKKLELYNDKIRELHTSKNFSMHTFSNIITNNFKFQENRIEINDGMIIFRSLDTRIIQYLKLGLAIDPKLNLTNTEFVVKKIKDNENLNDINKSVKFKTLSPVVVRDFTNPDIYVNNKEELKENLILQTKYLINKYFNYTPHHLDFKLYEIKRKTVRISSSDNNESITTGFNLKGEIDTDNNTLKIIYYRGLGSKTGLGLGCIEVFNDGI